MKKMLVLSIIQFFLADIYCQSEATDVIKLTIYQPGLSYEKAIGRLQTLYGQLYGGSSIGYSYSGSFGSTFYFSINPAATLQYRYYYNSKKRAEHGKRTALNSMNYIAGVYETIYTNAAVFEGYVAEEKDRFVNSLGVGWGFQRNYPKRFSLDLVTGLSYVFAKSTLLSGSEKITENHGELRVMIMFNIGIWLNKKR
ncbi:MAG TPA: hypothetical protein VFW07_18830 [Parafilimonas sp.]|nr:hypothetical protein [Parafilimonas sp.]